MVLSVKLPILKKGKYILWTIKMEQYLAYIDYALWKVILNGNSVVQMIKDKADNEIKVPPVTAHQILARTRERKAKSTLLMAIPDEHLARFYGIKDAKTLWAAIKTKFGGNTESKKMQKNVLKQQFKIFSVSNSEGLNKGYDRFQSFLSMLEHHEAGSTNNTNELNAAYSVSTATGHSSQAQGSSSYADELIGHFARDCRSTTNSRNKSRDAGNARYIERDNIKRPVKEEDEQAFIVQDGLANDRFKKGKGYHAVPPLLTGNYMLPKPDLSSAPLIEDWETDNDDDRVFTPEPIPAKIDFVKDVVFTRSGRIQVSAAKPKAATSTYAAKPVNTAGPKQSVNFSRTRISAAKPKAATSTYAAKPVNTAGPKLSVNFSRTRRNKDYLADYQEIHDGGFVAFGSSRGKITDKVSAVRGNRVTAVKTLAGSSTTSFKNKVIVNSGCSRHMTGNKDYLADYQEIHDGGFVAFGSSRGKITDK
nr:ribonuclease H-like domain-containing protein [Tanacetum cinerariifolium]